MADERTQGVAGRGPEARALRSLPLLLAGLLVAAATPGAEGATAIYYSVGTSAADLKAGVPTLTIAAGVGTFSVAQAANVGVGDQVTYNGATTAYISSRVSATHYMLITATGGTPANVVSVVVNSIRRAFNSLSAAEAGSTDPSHLNTPDLVAFDYQLNWPCYKDAALTDAVTISGYLTGPANYIRLYTPVSGAEVGSSQRHSGAFGTGFQLNATNQAVVRVDDAHVRIEGLVIQATVNSNTLGLGGIISQPAGVSDVRISHNIIKGIITDGVTGYPSGIQIGANNANVHRVWNNVVYDFPHSTVEAAQCIGLNDGVAYVFNNTVFNCNTGIIKFGGQDAGTEVRNNVSIHNTALQPSYVDYKYLGTAPAATRSANVSSEASSETAALRNKTAFASYFQNTGTGDFHLKNTSLSLWTANGTDLSADANLPVTNDIDGAARVRPDIGADEFTGTRLYRSVGDTIAPFYLANGAGNALTISGGAATFGSALPAYVGVGDVIQYDSDGNASIDALAFIQARTNSQTYTVKDKTGATPTAVIGDNDWAIYRAYTSLRTWESQTENANISEPVENDVNPALNLVTANTIMGVACYVDVGTADTADTLSAGQSVTISGWTTDANHYIDIFTPVLSSHVGTTQRHSGVWDATKYRLVGSFEFDGLIWVQTEYVRVTGLQVENQANQANQPAGIEMDAGPIAELRVSHSILRATGPGVSSFWTAGLSHTNMGGVFKAWNNVIYNWGSGFYEDTQVSPPDGAVLYNNTIVNSRVFGIRLASLFAGLTYRVANNLVQGAGTNYSVGGVAGGLAYSATNLSQDATSPNVALRNRVVTFVGAPDFHLSPADLNAKDQGTNLSADPALAVLDDIDGGPRQVPWDIGADDEGVVTAADLADLAITKDDGQTTAVPGNLIAYAITVTNNGPDTLTSLFVNDSLPALTGVSFTPSTGTYNSGTGEWTGLNLAASQSVILTLTGTIQPFARGTLANTATVSLPAGGTDTNGTNDFASDSDGLNPSADVQIVKTDDFDPAPLGGILTYTLTVTNNGPSGATSVNVSDPLPLDMDLDAGPGAIVPSQGTCNYFVATRTVSCDLGNLGPTLVATVAIKVRPQALRLFSNTASVAHGEPDPTAGNDSEDETTLAEVSGVDVRFFTATSTSQRNVLEWVNPTDVDYVSTEIMVRVDRFSTGPLDGVSLYNLPTGGSGGRVKLPHDTGAGSNGQTFYYAAFVHRLGPSVSPGRFVTGRPFDHVPGPVKWAFATGATALAAPTVGGAGVIATSNDRVVYAMERGVDRDLVGVDSGEWPASFRPVELGEPVQLRSPVIPITVGPDASIPVVYLGAQDGKVYVVDAARGGSVGFPWGPRAIGSMVQAAPAGIFGAFGGTLDYLLLGTRHSTAANAFVALDPYTGVEVARYDNAGFGEIGIVNGMAAVDYGSLAPPPRAYFTSHTRGSANTLWCFDLAAGPVFTLRWPRPLGDIDSSPVLRGGRVYVGNAGTVYSIDALDGANIGLDRTFVHNDGQLRGFVFPDRASDDLYFATDNSVWGVTDDGSLAMPVKFGGPISLPNAARPSPVLFVPGSHYLYVGGSDGKLYEIDTALASPVPNHVRLGNGLAVVGAPSLDRDFDLVHVGTEAGIFYAVQVPLPPCIQGATCTTSSAGQACWVSSTAECATKSCTGVAGDCQ